MKKLETILDFKNATPKTYRFEENNENPIIRNLYLVQSHVDGEAPEKIKVTIESA